MENRLIISKPYIKEEKSDIFDESVKLCANITMINPNNNKKETKECYYEFNKKYKEYLCPERSDAFVMGLLSCAMELNMNIEFEAPISERLYYQLMTYYIPMVAKNNPNYPMHNIKLIGPTDNTPFENKNAVATGCSGGVDSFYTIIRHLDNDIPNNFKLTHIVYNSCCTFDSEEERIIDNYKKNFEKMKSIADGFNFEIIGCFNNLNKFYKFPYKAFNTFFTTIIGGCAYALQKLISIYYASSGDPISEFNLSLEKTHGHDSSVFDVFTTQCMNTENLSFYSTGSEYTRIEKEVYISDNKVAQDKLIVCLHQIYKKDNDKKYDNCSTCSKCLRTMSHLYVCNKLENFKNSFDVENFMKHKTKYLGKMIGTNKKSYVEDMKKYAKKNKVVIPLGSYFYAYFLYKPLEILRKTFKKSSFARKIYYKLNLDYKINGYRGPGYEYYKEKLGKK